MGPMRSGDWALCGLETEPGMVWRMGLYGLETGPGIVWKLCQGPPGDWAWCCVSTGPGDLWRLGRCSPFTRSGRVWRLGPVQPRNWSHCGLETEYCLARRLWSVQSGDLARHGLATEPGETWKEDSVVSGH
ncbi:hypothetical protein chiPu_0018268 [Chiloscyllium punctatum]|uniref:Uncharacterized protein n=1 Tax=Chiloscyllium punctatum TaxID=137246 RepID=A0A401RM40_CHIPU|nr:hypothetical protein [Chiloscyllium punctatum]